MPRSLRAGATWRLALGASQRTVQRALVKLEAAGRVHSIGRTRAKRWLSPPLAEFTTILLLPVALPLACGDADFSLARRNLQALRDIRRIAYADRVAYNRHLKDEANR